MHAYLIVRIGCVVVGYIWVWSSWDVVRMWMVGVVGQVCSIFVDECVLLGIFVGKSGDMCCVRKGAGDGGCGYGGR